MEPWDGPTMISFCNGDKIGALTDRNGLRPGRYTITKDNYIVFLLKLVWLIFQKRMSLIKGS